MRRYKIESVARALGLRFNERTGNSESKYIYCPFCGENKGKLNINLIKGTYRCNRCEESGGVRSLVEAVRECSTADAIKWLRETPGIEYYGADDSIPVEATQNIASDEVLNQTYRALLNKLTLKEVHMNDLIKRGLSYSAIRRLGFKSVPDAGVGCKIAEELYEEGYTLSNVPGFYKQNGKWRICGIQGYLIPFINCAGNIIGFQIRTDNPGSRNAKYVSFTSVGKECGTQTSLQAHLVGYKNQTKVFLTEGALKADIAVYLSYKLKKHYCAFLAIPGVNNRHSLEKAFSELKDKGVKTIYDCFDMDRIGNKSCEKNENVFKAVKKIKEMALSFGFDWKSLEWEYEKGIDDYLLFLVQSIAKF